MATSLLPMSRRRRLMGMGMDLPGMDLESMDPSMSMDDDEEQAPDPEMLGGGEAAGQEDMELAQMEQDLNQGGVTGDGVPSSPLNVTPLSERTAGLGKPPGRAEQIGGLLSDIAAGALAGSQFRSRPGTALKGGGMSSGQAAVLGGMAGIQAGEQNRFQREVRRRTFDQQDFARQQALYNAELNQAKFNRTEERLDAQANAVKAHYRFMEQKARIDGKKLLLEMKNGTVKIIGKDAWRIHLDGRPPERLTNTEQGAKALSIKQWKDQAKAMDLSTEETNEGILKILSPGYKTTAEKEREKVIAEKTEAAKPQNIKLRREAKTREIVGKQFALLYGNHDNTKHRIMDMYAHGEITDPDFDVIYADEILLANKQKKKAGDPTPIKVPEPKVKSFADLDREAKTAQQQVNLHAAASLIKKAAKLFPGQNAVQKAFEIMPMQEFNREGMPFVDEAQVMIYLKQMGGKSVIDEDEDANSFGMTPAAAAAQAGVTTPAIPAATKTPVEAVIPPQFDPEGVLN